MYPGPLLLVQPASGEQVQKMVGASKKVSDCCYAVYGIISLTCDP